VVPYNVNHELDLQQKGILRKQVKELQSQLKVNKLFTESSTEHDKLKTKHENLQKDLAVKQKINKILMYLYEHSLSRLTLLHDECGLVIEQFNEDVFKYLIKEMYRLTPQGRKALEERIVHVSEEIDFVFKYFKTQPTITGYLAQSYVTPGFLYYLAHGLPHPDPVINKQLEPIRETVGNWKNIKQ
jgi:hypothetical protein